MTDKDPEEVPEDPASVNPDGTVSVEYDWDESRSLSLAVLDALEASTDTDVQELGPLNDIVDADALDTLFSPTSNGGPRGPGYVTFEIGDHVVTVHSDGSIVVAPYDE